MAVDFKSLSKNDQGALISGVLAVLFTFFGSYITVSAKVGGFSQSAGHNAWDGWGVLGSLLLIGAVALVAVRLFAADVLPAGVPWNLVTLAGAAAAAVILIIKGLTFGGDIPSVAKSSVDAGMGWSGWVLAVLLIVFTAFTVLLFKGSGEQMPDLKREAPPA